MIGEINERRASVIRLALLRLDASGETGHQLDAYNALSALCDEIEARNERIEELERLVPGSLDLQ